MIVRVLYRYVLLGLVGVLGGVAAAVELRPVIQQEEGSSTIQASQKITGAGSRLNSSQHAIITDEATWQRVWLSHLGVIDAGAATEQAPAVDFSRSIVIAIVEDGDSKTVGIRIHQIMVDDEIVFFDYELDRRSQVKKQRRLKNVFGFFVIPRSEYEIVLRRPLKPNERRGEALPDRFREVARFPAASAAEPVNQVASLKSSAGPMLNIEFVHDAGQGKYDGVVGSPNDLWNLASLGTTAIDFMRYSDASASTARMRISRHDGAWGIAGQTGIFHGYIYHNCRCVDLEAEILDLPAGMYRAYVYAHGDAPNQNAAIELKVADVSRGKKATANDGTWRFRSYPFVEGIQYVTFEFVLKAGEDVRFISHRDGSDYSMFNAIQIVPIVVHRSASKTP